MSSMALGEPVRMDVATLTKTPYKVMCDTYLQNALNLNELWVAPQSTYTTTGDSGDSSGENGAPTKSEAEITDSGTASRDNDDAANAKARKEIGS